MARFFGEVGYVNQSVEQPADSGVWVDVMVERSYYGDIIRRARSLDEVEKLNPDIRLTGSVSIVADEYALNHYANIRYVKIDGTTYWNVEEVEVQRPRLILRLGSLYNGPKPPITP